MALVVNLPILRHNRLARSTIRVCGLRGTGLLTCMTQTKPAEEAPNNAGDHAHLRWQSKFGVIALGVTLLGLALALLTVAPQFSSATSTALALAACLGLYIASALLARPWMPDAYLNLSGLVAWLTLGLPYAVGVIAVGQVSALLIRRQWGGWLRLSPVLPHEQRLRALTDAATALAAVVASALVYRAFDGQEPLQTLSPAGWIPLLAALFGGFAVAEAVYALLSARLFPSHARQLGEHNTFRAMVSRMLPLPLAVILPLIYHEVDAAVFVISLAVVTAHAVCDRQAQHQAALSAALASSLSWLNALGHQAILDFDRQHALATACQTALDIAHADKAAIFLRQPQTGEFVLAKAQGLAAPPPADTSIPADRVDGATRVVSDVAQSGTSGALAEWAPIGAFRALAELPLQSGSQVLGYLGVYHDHPHHHSQQEVDLLRNLVNQLAAALNNAELLRELELYAFETSHLVHLSTVTTASLEPEGFAGEVSATIRQMMGVDWAAVLLIGEDDSQWRAVGISPPAPAADIEPLPPITELRAFDQLQTFQRGQPGLSDGLNVLVARYRLESVVLVPLTAQREVFGAVLVGCYTPWQLTEREMRLLQTAVSQFSSQVYNARLYRLTVQALNRQMDRLALVEGLIRHISATHDLNGVIRQVLDGAARLTGADMAALALLTEADDFWVIVHQYDPAVASEGLRRSYAQLAREGSVLGRVTRSGQPEIVTDNLYDPDYVAIAPAAYRSTLAAPLIRDDQVIGVLNLESTRPNFFTAEQMEFLTSLAAQAVISIEDARRLEALRHQVATLTSLRELSLRLSSAVDTETVAEAVLETARQLLESQYAVLFRYDAPADRLTLLASLESIAPAGPGPGVDVVRQTAYRAAHTGALQVIEAASISQPDAGGGPLSVAAAPIKWGDRVREVLCIIFTGVRRFQSREITALSQIAIQAEGHLENAALHERIQNASDRMWAILDSIRDGIILVDRDGRLAVVNPSAERLLGLPLSDHLSEPFVEVLRHYADLAENHLGYPPAALDTLTEVLQRQPERITRHQFERKGAANQTLYIEEIGSPVIDKDNLISGRLLVLRDITETIKLEEYRDEITNMVIHDLRGPLASIINAIRIARDSIPELPNYPVADKTLSLATVSAEKLILLVSSLLEIAKLESRQMDLQIAPVSVADLVNEAIETLLPSIQKARITVERHISPDLPSVLVDADKIRRVFINLLDNALRYTPADGLVRIAVTPEPVRDRLLVQVADSGLGIPPEERERIFDKYRQVNDDHAGRSSTGVGLGLTFCKLALEAHGQTIWVESDSPLPGACFAFTLPTA